MPPNRTSFFTLPTRKIRVDIITLFLFLVMVSTLTIITFSTYQNNKSLRLLSEVMVNEVGHGLIEKIEGVVHQTELIPQMAKTLVTKNSDLCEDNKILISYLVNLINLDPYISSINIAGVDGDMLSVYNVQLSRMTSYTSDPTKPLPETIKYAIRTIDREKGYATEKWEYRGTDGSVLAEENLGAATYDPRIESWYLKTEKWPHLQWSKVRANQWGEQIITVSTPTWDSKGELVSVIGVNVSLSHLANYVAHLKIGFTGQMYIISDGEIIIPMGKKLEATNGKIPAEVITTAYEEHKKTKKQSFLIKSQDRSYFTYFSLYPLTYDTKWLIEMIIPFEDFFGEFAKTQRQTLLISFILLILFSIIVFFSSKYISNPIVALSNQVDRIKQFDFEEQEYIDLRIEEIMKLQASIASMSQALKAFSLYVPKEIVRKLIQRGEAIKLGGSRRELTVLFTDIENFTSTSEGLTIDQLTTALGAYFDVFSRVILEHGGTIDKYIGDSIMAFWGAPEEVADHADRACLAALRSLKIYEEERATSTSLPAWKTRIGIHTGEAIVGNIGTSERMNYTAIGSSVNLAARLQSMNKEYHTNIVISESVHEKLGVRYVTRPLDFVTVKGKKNKITIYELVGAKKESDLIPEPSRVELCELFATAYFMFHQGEIKESQVAFLAIAEKFPDDLPTKLYLERIEKIL